MTTKINLSEVLGNSLKVFNRPDSFTDRQIFINQDRNWEFAQPIKEEQKKELPVQIHFDDNFTSEETQELFKLVRKERNRRLRDKHLTYTSAPIKGFIDYAAQFVTAQEKLDYRTNQRLCRVDHNEIEEFKENKVKMVTIFDGVFYNSYTSEEIRDITKLKGLWNREDGVYRWSKTLVSWEKLGK